ncbi:uncharacterized protein IWZ02DRAFT_375955 [Phyllosticta citriasiana]|uniref:uncharacterized protein n=1 Tax=Phyllosticta citriasiana TaxID=595635 RepID=UPI0030FDDE41
MSVTPAVTAALAAAPSIFRFATSSSLAAARRCPQCFHSWSAVRQARYLQTATAYQPHQLQLPPAPPRSKDIGDSTLVGNQPESAEKRPSRMAEQRFQPPEPVQNTRNTLSTSETEAQQAQTTAAPKPAPSSRERQSRFKFKPKKAAMTLSPRAVSALRELLDGPEPKLIKVGTKSKGCSGLAYHLQYVDKPGKFDDVVEQDGVKVLIDSKALIHILGSEMDWVEDKLSRRFVFKNPNITEQCGCGESFSVN